MPALMSPTDRVVAVVGHPDDAELMFYGTLRAWADAGADVTVFVATHGAAGISLADQAAGTQLAPGDRPAESAASYEGTGIAVECLGLEDGALRPDRPLVSAIEAALARLGCTVLLTHAVHDGNDHQDHHAVARAALNAAVRVASCTTVLHGQPHNAHSHVAPTVLVDITAYIDDKVKALARHQTQAGRYYLSEEFTRHRAAEAGYRLLPQRAADGRYFEGLVPSLLLLGQPERS
ncbi:PIG-L deacetylase family protein [Kitasatospora sp. LaBMicrA B282]|uniref:PIG-L deacetylase family protein n=1 Tax=Kitasatospora sp. LaBMicrA B282 TaxID=3420949 RepID=UPI003D11E576